MLAFCRCRDSRLSKMALSVLDVGKPVNDEDVARRQSCLNKESKPLREAAQVSLGQEEITLESLERDVRPNWNDSGLLRLSLALPIAAAIESRLNDLSLQQNQTVDLRNRAKFKHSKFVKLSTF